MTPIARTFSVVTTMVAAVFASVAPAAPREPNLSAGAARSEIALTPAMLPIDGFTTIHDPLFVRVLVLGDGVTQIAIVVVDQTSMGLDLVDEVKAQIAKATGTPTNEVLVMASHTFSAPHIFTGPHLPTNVSEDPAERVRTAAYHDAMLAAVRDAAQRASRGSRAVTISVGTGVSDVNVNRNVPMADGWWLGANPSGPSDKRLDVVRFDAQGGKPVALLINYPVQSAVMDHSIGSAGKSVTSDLGGAAVHHVERQFGNDAVGFFLTGAAGDQIPHYTARRNLYDKDGHFRTEDLGDAGYTLLDVQGERLGTEAVRVVQTATPSGSPSKLAVHVGSAALKSQRRPPNLLQIKPTRTYPFQQDGSVSAPFVVLRVGDLAVVGVQAELSAATGEYIRAHSPFAHTLVVTMVNGAAKYMPPREAYANINYEAMNSSFAAGSAETFAAAILARLRGVHDAR